MDTKLYVQLVNNLSLYDVPAEVATKFEQFTLSVYQGDQQNMYSKPMIWIGMYIAAASLLCIFAMAADLLHGLRNQKPWFPCNYFTINSAFLQVISVAMKLPMDITNSMPGDVDQMTKLGSMAFLCTMMANLLPSLATMDSKELLSNIIALGIMVITLVVNVCIQIQTGVVSYKQEGHAVQAYEPNFDIESLGIADKNRNSKIAIIYVALLLMLLIIHTCSSLSILKSKKMVEAKYQKLHHETTPLNQQQSQISLTVVKLRQLVRKYWIMAETGSSQLITICSVTTSACGVICVLSTTLHILTLVWTIQSVKDGDYKSDYKWSVVVIFAVQFFGVILGTIAPVCRCFAPLCFKVSVKSIKNHLKVFKVESYWTQKLHDWRRTSIPITFRRHKCKVITEILKIMFLNFCIEFQEAVVVTCKIISLVPFFIMICAFYCFKCLKDAREENKDHEDLRGYVLQLQDETEISGTTLKWLSESLERLIKKGEKRREKGEERKQQHGDLSDLIKKSSDFKGAEMVADRDHFQFLPPKKYQNSWSLSIATLTAIAVSLPGIDKTLESQADKLLSSVKAGLMYVKHVEESLKTSDDYISIQKAAGTLWLEIEVYRKWFGNKLQDLASRVDAKTTRDIVKSFNKIAKKMVDDEQQGEGTKSNTGRCKDDNSVCKSICANSMYRITYTILLSNDIDKFNPQQQFERISLMISGILAACLANLPKVIEMKCHTCCIEKREASVQVAARLLGETTEIIETLEESGSSRLESKRLAIY